MKKLRKLFSFVYIFAILVVCTVPMLGMFLGWGSESTENRTLSGLPELINATEDSKELNTEYTAELGDYISENFGFRQELVTANSVINEKLFFRASNEKVILGKDGWYYFNETRDDYTGRSALSDRGIYRLKKTLDLINEYAETNNITMVFFSAPNKNSMYQQFMPGNIIKSKKQSNLDRLSESMTYCDYYIDMKAELKSKMEKDSRYYYLKNDSHWNNLGALTAFNSIENNINERIDKFDYTNYTVPKNATVIETTGDLTDMLYPSIQRTDVQYDLDIPVEFASEQPLTNMMASEINTTCQGRYFNAICYRDSFFNSMINITSNAFARVRYTRTFPYDITAARSGKYNIAIVEIAERNLPTLLNEAPIMDAVAKNMPGVTTAVSSEQPCSFKDEGEYLKISGEIGDWAELETNSNIYIELRSSNGESYYYEAFPILSGDANGDDGFSIRISKYGLANDSYDAFVHVGDKYKTKYAKLKFE
ncbi:MAG: hypothetical protein PUB37_03880 [Firmicutes bacterium]|nr:hypothetical protein [Bacillota bacterium]